MSALDLVQGVGLEWYPPHDDQEHDITKVSTPLDARNGLTAKPQRVAIPPPVVPNTRRPISAAKMDGDVSATPVPATKPIVSTRLGEKTRRSGRKAVEKAPISGWEVDTEFEGIVMPSWDVPSPSHDYETVVHLTPRTPKSGSRASARKPQISVANHAPLVQTPVKTPGKHRPAHNEYTPPTEKHRDDVRFAMRMKMLHMAEAAKAAMPRRSHPSLPSHYQVPTTKLRKDLIWSLRSPTKTPRTPHSGPSVWERLYTAATAAKDAANATAVASPVHKATPPAPPSKRVHREHRPARKQDVDETERLNELLRHTLASQDLLTSSDSDSETDTAVHTRHVGKTLQQ